MAGTTSLFWKLFGTLLFGIIFTIPIIILFYFVRFIMRSIEKRKERIEKETTVI